MLRCFIFSPFLSLFSSQLCSSLFFSSSLFSQGLLLSHRQIIHKPRKHKTYFLNSYPILSLVYCLVSVHFISFSDLDEVLVEHDLQWGEEVFIIPIAFVWCCNPSLFIWGDSSPSPLGRCPTSSHADLCNLLEKEAAHRRPVQSYFPTSIRFHWKSESRTE